MGLCRFFPIPGAPIANCLSKSEWLESNQDVEYFEDEREAFHADYSLDVVSSRMGEGNKDDITSAFAIRSRE